MRRLLGSALLVGALAAGCGQAWLPTQPPSNSAPSSGGLAFESASVEQPSAVTDAGSAPPSFCSPCHGDATLLHGVTEAPFGYVAVGAQSPSVRAAAWISGDGSSWRRVANLPADEGTSMVAVAATLMNGTPLVVAVGSDSTGAAAWATSDGVAWTRAPADASLRGPLGGTRMTSIIAWGPGFLAAGIADNPASGRISSATWTSTDGLHWTRVSSPAFDGGHILALATNDTRIVAVGSTASETRGQGLAWVSDDGRTWRRLGDSTAASPMANGIPRGITFGFAGFVAVGLRSDDHAAAAWTSKDGETWTPAAQTDALTHYGQPVRMVAVAARRYDLLAVGWQSDLGNGSSVAWTSSDGGHTWARAPEPASFSGSELTSVVSGNLGFVLGGVGGYPDQDYAAVWLARVGS